MNTEEHTSEEQTPQNEPLKDEQAQSTDTGLPRLVKVALIWTAALLIVGLAVAFAKYQIDTKPKAERQRPPQQARLVTVEPAEQMDHTTYVEAMGPVVPAKQITVTPEVSGRIIFVSCSIK